MHYIKFINHFLSSLYVTLTPLASSSAANWVPSRYRRLLLPEWYSATVSHCWCYSVWPTLVHVVRCVLRRRYCKFHGQSTAPLETGPSPSMLLRWGTVYHHLHLLCFSSDERWRWNCSDDRTVTLATDSYPGRRFALLWNSSRRRWWWWCFSDCRG